MANPQRLIGLHFFNPVPQLPLVEVVKAPDTAQEWIEKGCSVVTAIGKFPLVVKSVPGFLVNRVLAPYMMEAMRRHEEGIEREKIDDAAKAFGMPVGPLGTRRSGRPRHLQARRRDHRPRRRRR